MRFYNRALSAEEFAENYKLDKERFNFEPNDYIKYDAEIEYLAVDSTNTANYIDLGWGANQNTNFEIKFSYPTIKTTAQGNNMGTIFGGRNTWNTRAYELSTYNKNTSSVGHFAYNN